VTIAPGMAVGNPVDVGGLNARLGDAAVSLRAAMEQIQSLWSFVQPTGAAGLEAIGFSPDDATAYFNASNYLQTVAGIYFGTGAQPDAFDFDSALALIRGTG
jgi:hypothetical protein